MLLRCKSAYRNVSKYGLFLPRRIRKEIGLRYWVSDKAEVDLFFLFLCFGSLISQINLQISF